MTRRRWHRIENGPRADVHVLPIGDLRVHEETRDCWCRPDKVREPYEEAAIVVVHNALDGRELIEAHGIN